MLEEFLWVEKYRPKTIAETILPAKFKTIFQKFVDTKEIPNLLLTGNSGMGKTTVAKAMVNEIGCDYIVVNASLDGGIDTLRHRIQEFAGTMSFQGGRKYVILDEADRLTPQTQESLRMFIEEYSANCGFIMTCNYRFKIIEALHSRCTLVEFTITKAEKRELSIQFYKRICAILKKENVKFDKDSVASLLRTKFPDFRKIIGDLQTYSACGEIDSGILTSMDTESYALIVKYIKEKDFSNMRQWCAAHMDQGAESLFRRFYDGATETLEKSSIPHLVVLIAEFQFKAAHVADQEINLAAFFTHFMTDDNIQFR